MSDAASLLTPSGANAVRLVARVTPRGGRDAVDGLTEDGSGRSMLKLRVSAPPADGAANDAVVALLAKALGMRKSAVRVISGHAARVKQIEIEGAPAELRSRLDALLQKLDG